MTHNVKAVDAERLSVVMLGVVLLSFVYAERRIFIDILSDILLSAFMFVAVMPRLVAPSRPLKDIFLRTPIKSENKT